MVQNQVRFLRKDYNTRTNGVCNYKLRKILLRQFCHILDLRRASISSKQKTKTPPLLMPFGLNQLV